MYPVMRDAFKIDPGPVPAPKLYPQETQNHI